MKQQELELILKKYQTPAYVFDLDALAGGCSVFRPV